MSCPKCGITLSGNEDFCPNCHHNLKQQISADGNLKEVSNSLDTRQTDIRNENVVTQQNTVNQTIAQNIQVSNVQSSESARMTSVPVSHSSINTATSNTTNVQNVSINVPITQENKVSNQTINVQSSESVKVTNAPVSSTTVSEPTSNTTNVQNVSGSTPVAQQNRKEETENKSILKENKSKFKLDKKVIIIGIIAILTIVLVILGIKVFNKPKENNEETNNLYGSDSGEEIVTTVKADNDIVKFIDGTFTDVKVNNEEDALKVLEAIKDELKVNDVKSEFKLDYSDKSEDITYYRFNQIYKGVEVYNNNVIISVDSNGNVLSFSGYYIPNINIDINGKKTQEELEEIVKQNLGDETKILSSKKYVYADNQNQDLVYVISGYSNTDAKEYIIDANSGEIIITNDIFNYDKDYTYTGKGVDDIEHTITLQEFYDPDYNRDRYRLVDSKRKIAIYDARKAGPIFSTLVSMITNLSDTSAASFDIINGELTSIDNDIKFVKDSVTVMKDFEDIYDYYKNVLGRDSYDNKGSRILINLGVTKKTGSDESLDQAMWCSLSNQMYIGDYNGKSFGASKDVLAHEFTHGVIQYTAGFASSPKEEDKDKPFLTGSLNEAYSDILGSLIEGKNWTIGEDTEIVRNLLNPLEYGDPKEVDGLNYFPTYYAEGRGRTLEQLKSANGWKTLYDYDGGGKHLNATVVGHAAYLMYSNGAFESREQMAKVWYNSLFLLSSYSNFEDCALAVIKSAKNLGLSDSSIQIIEQAFIETKMLPNKQVNLTGTVSSGSVKLSNVKITIYKSDKIVYELTTDDEGNFNQKLETGTYKLFFEKEGFQNYTTSVTIHGDTKVNIKLTNTEKAKNNNTSMNLNCTSGNCVKLTICTLDNKSGKLDDYCQTYSVDNGYVLGTDIILDTVNKYFGEDYLKTDGETFKMTYGGYTLDYAWYYKGTNTKFNFNKPITKDTEIEMKMLNGMIDNETIKDIQDLIGGNTDTKDNTTKENNNENISGTNGPTFVAAKEGETHKGIVYLDPTNIKATCNEELAKKNTNENGAYTGINKGCMKFYIFDDSGDKYTMILDHNTSGDVAWNSNNTNTTMLEVATRLSEDTKGWIGSPRLISESEIRTITNNTGTGNFGFSGSNYPYQTLTNEQKIIQQSYHWLFDNLYSSTANGGRINDSHVYPSTDGNKNFVYGYWTSTAYAGSTSDVWFVHREGRVYRKAANDSNDFGVRPVITISKSDIK